jgi:hypothetical protein
MLKKINFQSNHLHQPAYLAVITQSAKTQKKLFLEKSNICSNWSLKHPLRFPNQHLLYHLHKYRINVIIFKLV